MNPTDVVQVCDAAQTACQWVPVSRFYVIPPLSVEDAMILSGAVFGLYALVWALRKLRTTLD